MKRLVEFTLADQTSILAEVEDPTLDVGVAPVGRMEDLIEQAQVGWEQALGTIKPVAETVIQTLRELSDPPDQVTAELAFKFTAGGTLILSLGTEASCKVTLSWNRGQAQGQRQAVESEPG